MTVVRKININPSQPLSSTRANRSDGYLLSTVYPKILILSRPSGQEGFFMVKGGVLECCIFCQHIVGAGLVPARGRGREGGFPQSPGRGTKGLVPCQNHQTKIGRLYSRPGCGGTEGYPPRPRAGTRPAPTVLVFVGVVGVGCLVRLLWREGAGIFCLYPGRAQDPPLRGGFSSVWRL